MEPVKVTVYRWAGKKWFLRIDGECIECDLAVGQVRRLVQANPTWPIQLEIKPWLTHVWESLRHGGWHAPVVLVDGIRIRQGTIPTMTELHVAVRRALEVRGADLGHTQEIMSFRQEIRSKSNSAIQADVS